jgi:tape measure domain-containing protein
MADINTTLQIYINTQGAASATSQMGKVASAAKSMGQSVRSSSTSIGQSTSAIGQAWNRMTSIVSAYAFISAVRAAENAVTSLGQSVIESVGDYQRLGLVIKVAGAREVQQAALREKQLISLDDAYRMANVDSQKYLKQTQDIALTIPVKEKDLANTFRTLAGYNLGVEGSMAYAKALSSFGLATGRTSEEIYRMSLALGQMKAKGKLAGEEMRQFTNAGLSMEMIVTALNKQFPKMGVTTGNFYKKMREGSLKAQPVLQALLIELQEFESMAPKISKTWAGIPDMMGNIGRVVNRTAFGPLLEEFTKPFGAFIDMFDPVKGERVWRGISTFGQALGRDIRPFTDWLTSEGVPALKRFYEGLAENGTAAERLSGALAGAFRMDTSGGQLQFGKMFENLWAQADVPGIINAGLETGSRFAKSAVTRIGELLPEISTAIADTLTRVDLSKADIPGIRDAIVNAVKKLGSDERVQTASFDIGKLIGTSIGEGIGDIFAIDAGKKAQDEIGKTMSAQEGIKKIAEKFGLGLASGISDSLGLHIPPAVQQSFAEAFGANIAFPGFGLLTNPSFIQAMDQLRADIGIGLAQVGTDLSGIIARSLQFWSQPQGGGSFGFSPMFAGLGVSIAQSIGEALMTKLPLLSTDFTNGIAGAVQNAYEGMVNLGSLAASYTSEGFRLITTKIGALHADISTGVQMAVEFAKGEIGKQGEAIVGGLAAGVQSGWDKLGDIPGSPAWLIDQIQKQFIKEEESGSPAMRFVAQGMAIAQGLALGIVNGKAEVFEAIRQVINAALTMSLSQLDLRTMLGSSLGMDLGTTAATESARRWEPTWVEGGVAALNPFTASLDSATKSAIDWGWGVDDAGEEVDDLGKSAKSAASELAGIVGLKPSGDRPLGVEGQEAWDELARQFKAAAKEGEGNKWFEMYRSGLPAWARGDEGLSKQAFGMEAERFYENPLAVQGQYLGAGGIQQMMQRLAQDSTKALQSQFSQEQLKGGVIGMMLQNPQQAQVLAQWAQSTGTDMKSVIGAMNIPTIDQILMGQGLGPNASPVGGFAGAGPTQQATTATSYIQTVADMMGMNGPMGMAATDLMTLGINPINQGIGTDLQSNADTSTDLIDTQFTLSGQTIYNSFTHGKEGLNELDARAKEVGSAIRNEYFKDFTQVITVEVNYEGGGGGSSSGPVQGVGERYSGPGTDTGHGLQRGLFWKVPGAGSGDIVPFRAMVEPGEVIQVIPRHIANGGGGAATSRDFVIHNLTIANGWDEAYFKHCVQEWAFEE